MKKFNIFLLILICLSFSMLRATPAIADTVIKEGVHKVTDFNFSPNHVYTIENTSPNSIVYAFIFDENQVIQETLRLKPNSLKYNLIPLEPDYKIVIVGNGGVVIS